MYIFRDISIKIYFFLKRSIFKIYQFTNIDINFKDKSSDYLESKCILFCKNKAGYERLLDISSTASTEGFYYVPRIDYKSLDKFWDDKDLLYAVPFYDSFIHKNKFRDLELQLSPF